MDAKKTIRERLAVVETEITNFHESYKEDMNELKGALNEHIKCHRRAGFIIFQNLVAAIVGGVVAIMGLFFKNR